MKGNGVNKLNGQKNSLNMLDAVNRLKKAGVEGQQAEEIVRLQQEFAESQLATKHDIALIQKDIEELRKETKQDIALIQRDIAELKKDIKEIQKEIKEIEIRLANRIYTVALTTLGFGITAMIALGKSGLLTP